MDFGIECTSGVDDNLLLSASLVLLRTTVSYHDASNDDTNSCSHCTEFSTKFVLKCL